MTRDYSLGEIAAYLKAELRGDPEVRITGLNTLQDSVEGQLSFLSNTKYSIPFGLSSIGGYSLGEKR
jgi:UDP-3-O-[3-hydroxymyristoyl] glucosamine N-acyltransferase